MTSNSALCVNPDEIDPVVGIGQMKIFKAERAIPCGSHRPIVLLESLGRSKDLGAVVYERRRVLKDLK